MSAANGTGFAQATDLRIMRGSSVRTDTANKSVLVRCAEATFSVSYCGLARLGPRGDDVETDRWLLGQLDDMRVGSLSLTSAFRALRARLDDGLSRTAGWGEEHFTVSGVGRLISDGRGFIFWISNHLTDSGDERDVSDSLTEGFLGAVLGSQPSTQLAFLAVGQDEAISREARDRLEVKRANGSLHRLNPKELAFELLNILRDAYHDDETGYVGINQRAVFNFGSVGFGFMGNLQPPVLFAQRCRE